MKRLVLLASAWLLLTTTPGRAAEAVDAADLLRRVAEHYARLGTLGGQFVQSYTNQALGRTIEEQGRLIIAPPDKMRWEYTEPEEKLFVSSDEASWFYLPEDELAYRVHLEGQTARRLPTRLMAGDLGVLDEYELQSLEESEEDANEVRLYLRPLREDDAIDGLVLVLSRSPLEIRAIQVKDTLGNRTIFSFSGIGPMKPVDPELFRFTPPEGVEIADEG